MKRKEFEKLAGYSLEALISKLQEEVNDIVSIEDIKDMAIDFIKEDSVSTAIHLLQAITADEADYYIYDASMGSLETPVAIHITSDLEQFVEE